jgi:hypothetical protein
MKKCDWRHKTLVSRIPKFILIPVFVFTLFACNKDKFPDQFVIYGRWIELTNEPLKTEIEFKRQNVLFLTRVHDTIREYRYLLEKQDELQIFEIAEYPLGIRSVHKVNYNKKDDLMTIYGLYPTTGNESKTIFKRR